MKKLDVSAAIYILPYWDKDISEVPWMAISAEQLEKEYIY